MISLKAIGASKTAGILQEAINQFPNQSVPKDREERQAVLEKIGETGNDIFDMLDQKFFRYEEDLNFFNINYVRENKDKF